MVAPGLLPRPCPLSSSLFGGVKGELNCWQCSAMGVSLMNLVRRAVFVLFIVANSPIHVDAQKTPEGGELLNFIATQQQRGSVLTYAQSYVDDENERVSYNGTLYAVISLFKLDECKVTARVAIQDRYSGAIEHKVFGRVHLEPTGQLKDDTVYEYRFNLGELSADAVHPLGAIPAQLNIHTTVRCEEDRSCNLSWIQISAPDGKIAETKTVNGIQDVDSRAKSIVLPITSPEEAAQAAKLFNVAIGACSVNTSAHK
jgi:hypothetical protein